MVVQSILVRRRWTELVAGHEPQVKAALGIQRVVRGAAARRQVAHMVREKEAAMVVQGAMRQRIARKTTQKLRSERQDAEARKAHEALLQKQAEEKQKRIAATHIQRAARGRIARKRASVLANERLRKREREQAAIQIQRVARGRCARRNFKRLEVELRARQAERQAATRVQASYRGFRVRRVADKFESLTEQIRAQRAAGRQAADLVLAAVAVHELRARSASRLAQCLAKSLLASRKMQKQRVRSVCSSRVDRSPRLFFFLPCMHGQLFRASTVMNRKCNWNVDNQCVSCF